MNRRPAFEAECTGYFRVGLATLHINEFAGGMVLLPGIGNDAEKAVLVLGFRMGGNERAFALLADEDVFRCQLVYRLANCSLAHAESLRKLDFAWDGLAGLPFTADEALRDQYLDLIVEGPETW